MSLYKDGTLKAVGFYENATRQACVSGRNNAPGARQQWDFISSQGVQGITTNGNQRGCMILDPRHGFASGSIVQVSLTHVGSGGDSKQKIEWILL